MNSSLQTIFTAQTEIVRNCVRTLLAAAHAAGDEEAANACLTVAMPLNDFLIDRGWWGPKIPERLRHRPTSRDSNVAHFPSRQPADASEEA